MNRYCVRLFKFLFFLILVYTLFVIFNGIYIYLFKEKFVSELKFNLNVLFLKEALPKQRKRKCGIFLRKWTPFNMEFWPNKICVNFYGGNSRKIFAKINFRKLVDISANFFFQTNNYQLSFGRNDLAKNFSANSAIKISADCIWPKFHIQGKTSISAKKYRRVIHPQG